VVGSGVGPFAERCLDEALGLTVGLGCVGPGSDVLEAQLLAGIPKGFGTVTGAVVGHDALDGHAQAFVVGDGGFEEGHGAFLALALEHLGEGDARSIVDADMDELPASAPVAAALAVAGDAVAYAIELAELLYVDVDQLAGMLALVAAHRLGGLQHLELVQAQPFENPAHGRRRDADLAAIALPVSRWRRSTSICSTVACGVGRYSRCGRELRSTRPPTPSFACRLTHLRTVRGHTP